MKRNHAEIAGAGLAGLTAAVALARRGWSVRVHERHESLRAQGFGITIHANGLRVLEAVGALEAATEGANSLGVTELRDGGNNLLSRTVLKSRGARLSRYKLVSALAEQASAAGAEFCYASPVAGATRDGELCLENGRRLKADLVIGADGVNSRVRDSLNLVRSRKYLKDGAMRLMISRQPEPTVPENSTVEWWSQDRRIIFGPCSPTEIYIALACKADDALGRQVPLDRASWTQAFPPRAELFERIHREADWPRILWVPFQSIDLKRWSAGRVAVVGDAAHAMPPNLGQGGGCSLMNALGLAVALEHNPADIEGALAAWEARERPLTEHTQRWSRLYSVLAEWPRPLRTSAFWVLGRPWIQAQYRRTANHIPTGAAPPNQRSV